MQRRIKDFIGPARATKRATQAVPGSADKLAVLAARAAARQELFSTEDKPEAEVGLRIEVGRNGKPLVVGLERDIAEKQLYLTAVRLGSFSERLLFLKRRRGLLTLHLARASGLTWTALYYLETGQREPALRTAIALAQALQVPVSILAGELL